MGYGVLVFRFDILGWDVVRVGMGVVLVVVLS